ncbi:hypothetical protein MASR1M101_18720 [Gemmatimonas sp.]
MESHHPATVEACCRLQFPLTSKDAIGRWHSKQAIRTILRVIASHNGDKRARCESANQLSALGAISIEVPNQPSSAARKREYGTACLGVIKHNN